MDSWRVKRTPLPAGELMVYNHKLFRVLLHCPVNMVAYPILNVIRWINQINVFWRIIIAIQTGTLILSEESLNKRYDIQLNASRIPEKSWRIPAECKEIISLNVNILFLSLMPFLFLMKKQIIENANKITDMIQYFMIYWFNCFYTSCISLIFIVQADN